MASREARVEDSTEQAFSAMSIPLRALDPSGKTELSSLDVEAQTHRAIDDLTAVLRAAGLSVKDVAATTLYVADLKDFEAINRAYGS